MRSVHRTYPWIRLRVVGGDVVYLTLSLPEQALNESASRLFRSGEEAAVEEGVAIMNEVIIPCLHLMSRDASLAPEDADAMETIRDHWCTCLSPDMEGEGTRATPSYTTPPKPELHLPKPELHLPKLELHLTKPELHLPKLHHLNQSYTSLNYTT